MNDEQLKNPEDITESKILILGSLTVEKKEIIRTSIASKLFEATSIEVINLQTQINIFLNQLDTVLSGTPEKTRKL